MKNNDKNIMHKMLIIVLIYLQLDGKNRKKGM